MSAFLPNIPNANDFLDTTSQPQLKSNNQALDARFGVDHYKFSDATGQSGKHNTVTTPIFIDSPPTGLPPVTIATEPKIYAFQQTAPFGVLQYSKGWAVAAAQSQVPSPITTVQSQATGISLGPKNTAYVMDFTGLPRAIAHLYYGSFNTFSNIFGHGDIVIFWNGSTFNTIDFPPFTNGNALSPQVAGNIINLVNQNTLASGTVISEIYFTMHMLRMQ